MVVTLSDLVDISDMPCGKSGVFGRRISIQTHN